jgi:2-(1,2-epoxy-1,2-dihydrophenyl)acetyl-CoA isomerase
MAYETILYTVTDGVATITLNRPDKYNAFTKQMILEATDAFKQAGRDAQARAVVLTGAGKAFCSGQDLGDAAGMQINFLEHVRQTYNPMISTMRALEKPILGVINGVAAGAGVGVALACDLRIVSDRASFVFAAFIGIGLVPDSGLNYSLPRLVGPAKAFELVMLADAKNRVNAQQAYDLGLCVAVVEHDKLADEAQALAARLAKMPTRGIALTKRLMNETWDHLLTEMLDLEAQLQHAASQTQDAQEGVLAFLEKRDPNFTGR